MTREEFLKEMVAFGTKLLEEETKPKLNTDAIISLQELYDGLAKAVNAAADLEQIFGVKDKRSLKAKKAVSLIMKAQELMNPIAEDADIDLI